MSAVPKSMPLFRPLVQNDIPRVMAIEGKVYEFPWTEGNFRDSLAAGYSSWACEMEGRFVGYGVMMLAGEDAHLLNVSIAAESQGRGLGRALVAHFMEVARGHHARILLLEVRPSNTLALGLYASMGFEQIGIRRNYYPSISGREDAMVLRRIL
jgi:[ribosomal protein S18]-alanine N-acetyltransferase